jgi:hypothetical protein
MEVLPFTITTDHSVDFHLRRSVWYGLIIGGQGAAQRAACASSQGVTPPKETSVT